MGKTQDGKLVSTLQDYEIDYLHDLYGASKAIILKAAAAVGVSRSKIEKKLEDWGYKKTKPKRKKK